LIVSGRLELTFFQGLNNRRFLGGNFIADKNELGLRGLERFQIPASGTEIEKLRAVLEAHETFSAMHVRGQTIREALEAIAREIFVGGEYERFEVGLMLVFRPRHFFLAPDPEQ